MADKFDHGDGMIDWREFMAALRPDWEERGPLTDTQRIDDEIKRQVAQCTCRQKFKVFQVGEGKYRVSYYVISPTFLQLFGIGYSDYKPQLISFIFCFSFSFLFNLHKTIYS